MAQLSLLRKCLPFTLLLLATVTTIRAIPTVAQPNPTTLDHSAQTNSQPLQQPEIQLMQAQVPGLPMWVYPVGTAVLILLFLPKIGWIAGLIVIGEREVGIVTKKFSSKSLPAGRLIALNGEAGLQADTLPPGWHFGHFLWQYSVHKASVVVIPQDEIGLIVANDGAAIPPERILGHVVESENFQNARQFLTEGGEKGRQLAVLTTGTYRPLSVVLRSLQTQT